jgi:5'-3' exonuclease
MAKFKVELKESFPYKVIDVEGAEADDIIGTLAPRLVSTENVLILSSDSDFIQLQRYNTGKYHIKQYSPTQKKYVTDENPSLHLKEKIIRGDKGDGIPNIYSPSDCFANNLKQKPITQKKLTELLHSNPQDWTDEQAYAGFVRNEMIIDLTHIPSEITDLIINTYDTVKPAPKMKMMNYFVKHKLKNLLDVIEEF